MSPQTVDPDRVEKEARQLLDAKVAVVRLLATARQKVAHRQAALEEAEREDANCYSAATGAGWTAEELRKVGLPAPSRRPPGRPPAARRASADKRPSTTEVASGLRPSSTATSPQEP